MTLYPLYLNFNFTILTLNWKWTCGRRAQRWDKRPGSAPGDCADDPGQCGLHHARTLMINKVEVSTVGIIISSSYPQFNYLNKYMNTLTLKLLMWCVSLFLAFITKSSYKWSNMFWHSKEVRGCKLQCVPATYSDGCVMRLSFPLLAWSVWHLACGTIRNFSKL